MDPNARTSTTLRDFQKLRSEKLWAEFSFPTNRYVVGPFDSFVGILYVLFGPPNFQRCFFKDLATRPQWCLPRRAKGQATKRREGPFFQARKRNPNLNFLVRIFSGGGVVFHVKGWGPKSSVCLSKPRKIKVFWRDIPGFCWDIPGRARKAWEKKSLCSILVPYSLWGIPKVKIETFKRDWRFQARL